VRSVAPRRISLALVLVLVAGVFAVSVPPPPSQAEPCERTEAVDGANPLSQLRRSLKRVDAPRRRAPALQKLPALPAREFSLATAEQVWIVETIVAAIHHHRDIRGRAHARAPPAPAS
jgi:hypothetical protein